MFNHHTLHHGHTGKSGGIHPYFELLHITKGEAELEWMGLEFAAPSPSLFLLTPNTPHRLIRPKPPVGFWYIEIDMEEDEPLVSLEQAVSWNRLQQSLDYASADMRSIRRMIDELIDSMDSGKENRGDYDEQILLLDIRKTVRLIQNYLLSGRTAQAEENDRSAQDFVRSLMRYMETNYYEYVDLSLLSNRVHLNSSYLVRAFKRETGVTPMQYLNKLRLSAAMSYLVNTSMGIEQIAEATGFNSIHYFSRLFKRKHGVSPQMWRTMQQKR